MGNRFAAESGGSVAEDEPVTSASAQAEESPAEAPGGQPGGQPDSQSEDGTSAPAPASRRQLGCLIEVVETLVLTIVIFWVIQTFVAQPFQVQQESMHSTLEEGQYVLVDKLTPHFDSYSRGDIIVFNPVIRDVSCTDAPSDIQEGEGDVPFIKRVIGEPGDSVQLRNGRVLVNGSMLDEPYVHGAPTSDLGEDDHWIVPTDRVFVMGDNRTNSIDSRAFGPICVSDVVGRAWLRYWPINTLGILQTPTYTSVPPSTTQSQPNI